ncbi:hypothetical protein D3C75_1247030 [compost metagenome]
MDDPAGEQHAADAVDQQGRRPDKGQQDQAADAGGNILRSVAEGADGGRHLGILPVAELDHEAATTADHHAGQDQQQQDQQPAP